jgi:hypothetical protein
MAKNPQVGDNVYVPANRVGWEERSPRAVLPVRVAEVKERSVRVELPDKSTSDFIGSSAVLDNLGVLLIRIGDYGTEWGLLDPLAKSILQFLRILLPDDVVTSFDIRSLAEFTKVWADRQAVTSHVIIVGHGATDGIIFGVDGKKSATDVLGSLAASATPKVFLSLCCQTGYKDFAKPFSEATICSDFIAPFHSIHGAIASQFCQTFFCNQFLEGKTAGVAFNSACASVPGPDRFRLWRKGAIDSSK